MNDAENGVFLVKNTATKNANAGVTAIPHSKIHTKKYAEELHSRLSGKTSKVDIHIELASIRTEILAGTLSF